MTHERLRLGLWHLGSVTAACLADPPGASIVGLDPDAAVVAALNGGRPPLVRAGARGSGPSRSRRGPLPVHRSRRARRRRRCRVGHVRHAGGRGRPGGRRCGREVDRGALPAPRRRRGRARLVAAAGRIRRAPGASVCRGRRRPPGRVRLQPGEPSAGKAIEVFRNPERIVVGARGAEARARIGQILEPITGPSSGCGRIGRDDQARAQRLPRDLGRVHQRDRRRVRGDRGRRQGGRARAQERGANRARRVPGPGAAFAGGTLARDIAFLLGAGSRLGLATPLFAGVKASNDVHRQWARRRLGELLGELPGKTVAVLGLTYKPDTDTLRRSESVGLCHWLVERGVRVRAYDPAIREPDPSCRPPSRCRPPSTTPSARRMRS